MTMEKKRYKDPVKYARYIRRKKQTYRANSGSGLGRSPWTDEQALMTVKGSMSDREVAARTGHSIEAVQAKRRRMRKGLERVAGYEPESDPNNPYAGTGARHGE